MRARPRLLPRSIIVVVIVKNYAAASTSTMTAAAARGVAKADPPWLDGLVTPKITDGAGGSRLLRDVCGALGRQVAVALDQAEALLLRAVLCVLGAEALRALAGVGRIERAVMRVGASADRIFVPVEDVLEREGPPVGGWWGGA